MLNSIKGFYEDGHIFFNEAPPVTTKTQVIITFLPEEKKLENVIFRKPGGLNGLVTIPDDFNEPLEDLNDYMY